tara:strand:+ start:711 stop:932 length:222 start_codon:yes stop_codon:yes gene_type:complete
MYPKAIPNLNHNILSGFSKFEFIKPSIKKIIATKIDQILSSAPCAKGHKLMIKNIKKNTKPKFRLELILILDL